MHWKFVRFRESPLGPATVDWDHEPTCFAGSAGILPASRRFRVEGQNKPAGRQRSQASFMESPLAISAVHRDHESETRKSFGIKASVFRFMESPLSAFFRMNWVHEP